MAAERPHPPPEDVDSSTDWEAMDGVILEEDDQGLGDRGLAEDSWDGAEQEPEQEQQLGPELSPEPLEAATSLSTVMEEGSEPQQSLEDMSVASELLSEVLDGAVERAAAGRPAPSDGLLDWLQELGAAEFFERFIEEGFEDVRSVVQSRLSEDDLRELGIVAMATRKRVLHALSAAAAEAAEMGGAPAAAADLTAAVEKLVAALEPAVPAVLAQLERLEPQGLGHEARPTSARPVRTRGLLAQHVSSRRPVVADLAAAQPQASDAHADEREPAAPPARRSPPAPRPETAPLAARSPSAQPGSFSIGGVDLASMPAEPPPPAGAAEPPADRARSPEPSAPAPQPAHRSPQQGMDAAELAQRLEVQLSQESIAATPAEVVAELTDEIRRAVLAWRAANDPYQQPQRLLRDMLAERDEGAVRTNFTRSTAAAW